MILYCKWRGTFWLMFFAQSRMINARWWLLAGGFVGLGVSFLTAYNMIC